MIYDESVLDGLGIVVLSDRQFAAAVVAYALDLRRKILDVVARLALGASATAGDAILDDFVRNVDQDGALDGSTHLLENLGLGEIAREAVEKHRDVARRFGDDILDHAGDKSVGNEVAALHIALSLKTGLGPLRDSAAKEISGGNMLQVGIVGGELARNRTLPRTRGTEKNYNIHGISLI